jgi:hypothetical protein
LLRTAQALLLLLFLYRTWNADTDSVVPHQMLVGWLVGWLVS